MQKGELELLKKLAENLEWHDGPPLKDGASYEIRLGEMTTSTRIVYSFGIGEFCMIGAENVIIRADAITAHRRQVKAEYETMAALRRAIAKCELAYRLQQATIPRIFEPPHGHDLSKLRIGEKIMIIPDAKLPNNGFEVVLIAIESDSALVIQAQDSNYHVRFPLHKIDALGYPAPS